MNTSCLQSCKSIHIFAWPFTYEEDEGIFTQLRNGQKEAWQRKSMNFAALKDDQQIKDAFMLQQYLSRTGQKIFIGDDSVCEVYEYKEDKIENLYYYIEAKINKRIENEIKIIDKLFELPIKGIELHLYHKYQVGILFIQIVNNDIVNREDIQLLNDVGRRLELPFIPSDKENGFILCAEQLGIKQYIDGTEKGNIFSFRNSIKKEEYSLTAANFIYDILEGDAFAEDIAGHRMKMVVKGHEDERMFLYSLIVDAELSGQIANQFESEKVLKTIYALVHADAGDASCQDQKMLQQILDKELYTRWREYGTLYGISNYSFVCITGNPEDTLDSVIRPFVTEYMYMVSLVLAQRMEIQAMSVKTSHEDEWNGSALRKIKKNYSEFKNQLLIQEFSNQEQGMELYIKLQEQLFIDRDHDILDEQLDNIYEVVSVENAEKIQKVGRLMSLLTAIATLSLYIGECFSNDISRGQIITFGVAIVISCVVVFTKFKDVLSQR